MDKKCKWYVSIDRPECGLVAVTTVTVKTRTTQARVDLCPEHKAVRDDIFARIRAEKKATR